ncbi:hypothetical protein BGZ90_009828 [Linnemannia elongata]|nr:hypothetical protein BGZ90_009828 [Linnemannia elongata]
MTSPPPPAIDPLTHPDIIDNIVPYLLGPDEDVPLSLANAALVCKSWNALYIPLLWREVHVPRRIPTIPDFSRQGVHVRLLEIARLEDSQMDLVGPFCRLVEGLALWECGVSVRKLVGYLRGVKGSLRWFKLGTTKVPVEDFVSAWVASGDTGGVGGGEVGPVLRELNLKFSPFRRPQELTWTSLGALLKALPQLESLHLAWVRISKQAIASESDRVKELPETGAVTETVAEEEQEKQCGLPLQDVRPLELPTKITYLFIRGIEMDDRTMVQLLDMTPRLATLLLNETKQLTGSFLETLPIICPELKCLTMKACDAIPTSAYTALFQTDADTDHLLQLERLCLDRCNLNDQTLYYIAISQADSLLDLTICQSDHRVTDTGIKDVLSRCHRLRSHNISNNPALTAAIMADEEEDNITNTRPPTEVEQKRWACYKTLRRLDIRELAIVDLGLFYAEEDPRIEENRAAFRRIRRRIRMLPELEDLTLSVSGVDDDLLQGFLGIEDEGIEDEENRGHQERQAEENEARTTTTTADNTASEGTGSSHHDQHDHQETRTLIGPRLKTLRVQGLKEEGYSGNDLDRFLRNFPGLKLYHNYQTHKSLYAEMAHGLEIAGIGVY